MITLSTRAFPVATRLTPTLAIDDADVLQCVVTDHTPAAPLAEIIRHHNVVERSNNAGPLERRLASTGGGVYAACFPVSGRHRPA